MLLINNFNEYLGSIIDLSFIKFSRNVFLDRGLELELLQEIAKIEQKYKLRPPKIEITALHKKIEVGENKFLKIHHLILKVGAENGRSVTLDEIKIFCQKSARKRAKYARFEKYKTKTKIEPKQIGSHLGAC